MQLTKQTDYAFRVLMALAATQNQPLLQIQKIVDQFQISKSHVTKIVQKLAHHGYIEAVRGQKGGIRLAKSLPQIQLREIVELMENNLEAVNCNEPMCLIRTHCQLKAHLQQATQQYLKYLESITLADIMSSTLIQEFGKIKH